MNVKLLQLSKVFFISKFSSRDKIFLNMGRGVSYRFFQFFTASLIVLFTLSCSKEETIHVATFEGEYSENKWALKDLDPEMPSDWSSYKFLMIEMNASSPQRFELGFNTENGLLKKTIHPFPGAWIIMSVPLDFYRAPNTKGSEMAATWNQPRTTGWINIYGGGFGPLTGIDSISVMMKAVIGKPTLKIRSIQLAKEDAGEAVLESKPLVDEFGQWISDDWPGKVKTLDDLKLAWEQEEASLQPGEFNYSKYGGYLNTQVAATGFFRVEKINGKWWFVDPDGHLFLAAGMNGVRSGRGTRTGDRENIFVILPPKEFRQPARSGGSSPDVSFSGWNLKRRYGTDWKQKWEEMALRRMDAWGLNAINWSDAGLNDGIAYAKFLYGWGIEEGIMGIPDVYSQEFSQNAEKVALEQCAPLKDDPWLLGYFIGNEPPWPGRESLAVDKILEGPATATQNELKDFLTRGDTPERRKAFIHQTFEKFLEIINAAIEKYDPNHLNLGIRFGGSPSEDVIKMAHVFDVYSCNIYNYTISQQYFDKLYQLTGRPILIGEFHFGTPGRGLAPGLSQVQNQHERGVAYRNYVENAFAHPTLIGTFWFLWRDQPNTGRNDGENYNIGIVDITDQPYPELVKALEATHKRLFDVHSGKAPPVNQMPEGRLME